MLNFNSVCQWRTCEQAATSTIVIIDTQEKEQKYYLCNEHWIECTKTENLPRIAEMIGEANERK